MGARVKIVLVAVGILVIGFGVVDSQAGRRHSHKLTVKYYFNDTALPPGNDPATSGVAAVDTGCPRGYRPTGGGYRASKIAVVPYADLNGSGFGAIAINQTDEGGTLTVHVACVKGKTSARRAATGGERLERLARAYRVQRR